jgi:capsid protein
MNLSQLAYSFLTGQWKLDRMRSQEMYEVTKRTTARRLELMYAGAEPGRKRPAPAQLSSPEDYRPAYQRITLIRGAREMEDDMPFFDGLLSDFETYVIGELKYTPTTGNPEADKVLREYLDWKFQDCDLTNREDLTTLAKLAVRSMKRDGEMGAAPVRQGDDLKLQFINGDRIGNPMMGTGAEPWNFGGIKVDPRTGAPTTFQIYNRLPKLNAYVFDRDIPASNFFHYFNPFRIDQYHGVTIFKNAVAHAFDMQQILEFTKLNIKWRSSQLPFVQNEQGKPRGSGYDTLPARTDGSPQPLSIEADGVTQTFMKIGEGVVEFPNDFPNGQFQNIMTELKRECAIAAKLPLEFVYRSEAGGVVQRFYAEKAEATFRGDRHLVKRKLLNPYKNRVIQNGIQTRELDLSRFGKLAQDPMRFNGRWQMGRTVSVDYGRETDADIKQIDAGLMSPDDYVDDNGRNLETILAEKVAYTRKVFISAAAIAEETGRPVDEILPYLNKIFPNPAPLPGGAQPDRAAEPDPAAV